jgi:(p)ppGpp synthase/HD superfamily hydrolase
MPTLVRAIDIAVHAHYLQVDKAGQPYILHPLRVMFTVQTRVEQITAVLHDVVEDTDWTFERLAEEGFSSEIIEALRALTKYECELRTDAAKRAVVNPIARAVKIADVTDNMNLKRIPNPKKEDFNRMKEYEDVMKILLNQ